MKIGKVAAEAKVSVQTVRFYERRGLIKPASRLASKYRDYPAETVRIVRFIKRQQKVGFTLTEIRDDLRAIETATPAVLNRRAHIEKRIIEINEQIRGLEELRGELNACLEACECRDGVTLCPGAVSLAEALHRR